MKLIYCLVLIIAFTYTHAAGENGKYSVESDLFGKTSPIKLLMQGVLENGSNTELSTYIKVFNQVYPLLKAFSNSIDPTKGESIKEYQYQWCMRDTRGVNIFCVNLLWSFVVGWRATQFHDNNRFYNLTVTPYAFMRADINATTEQAPFKLSVGPRIEMVRFTAPLSFEMVNKDQLCFSGFMSMLPITIDAGASASFLQCEIMIPEDVQTCGWTERLGARFFSRKLTDGISSTILDRTCVKSG